MPGRPCCIPIVNQCFLAWARRGSQPRRGTCTDPREAREQRVVSVLSVVHLLLCRAATRGVGGGCLFGDNSHDTHWAQTFISGSGVKIEMTYVKEVTGAQGAGGGRDQQEEIHRGMVC